MSPDPLQQQIDRRRRLTARVLPLSALTTTTRESMFTLYRHYYEATSRERFFADLATKDRVIAVYDPDQALRGFSTLKLIDEQWQGRPCRVLFSGDTIVHHRYWGEQSLAFTWIRQAGAIKAAQPDIPLYWLLIVKGHRTYRYLQAFARDYHPHWQQTTPASTQALMDHLGTRLFAAHYQTDSGVIRFPVSRGQLRPPWAEPRSEAEARPEVRFFLRRNPGYRDGDELLCLTELTADNLRPMARRLFTAGMTE